MDIELPPWLQWVAYLAGSQWPQGSETAMWRIADYWHTAAGELEALIPGLARVRAQTQAVLVGDTGEAADAQFAMLFDGEYSVDKLVDAMRALGELAENVGTEIQYVKLQICTTLAIAAASIYFALANFELTAGASLAEIPVAEEAAKLSIGKLVAMALERIIAALAGMLMRTGVPRLLAEGVSRLLVDAGVAAGIGAAQESGIEGIQLGEGVRAGIDGGQVLDSAISMGVAGAAGGLVGHGVGAAVGADGSPAVRALKGAVTGFASAEAANVAGTLAGHGDLTAGTFVGGALGLVHGFAAGAGAHSTSVPDATDAAAPVNAIEAHPILHFERQPDGTFAWVGEPPHDAATTATASPPTTPTDPATGDRARPSNGSPSASDSAAKSSNGSPSTGTTTQNDVAGPGGGSADRLPAAGDTASSPAEAVSAGADPAPAANTPLDSSTPQGTPDRSMISPTAQTGPVTDTAGAPVSDPPAQSSAAGPASATPAVPPAPTPAPSSAASSEHGPSSGPPRPTTDSSGLPESSAAGDSTSKPAGTPAAGSVDTPAAQAGPATPHSDAEPAAAERTGGTGADRPAQVLGRPGADGHVAGRAETAPAGRESAQRPDSASARGDSARSDGPAGARRGRPDPWPRSSDIGTVAGRHAADARGEGGSDQEVSAGPHPDRDAVAGVAGEALSRRVSPVAAEKLLGLVDTAPDRATRSRSPANFGRTAAGPSEQAAPDGFRTLDDQPGRRPHLINAAAGRPRHPIGVYDTDHPTGGGHPSNPPWHLGPAADEPPPRTDCAQCVAGELSAMYGRDIRVDAQPTPTGTPARALFEAAGSGAHFATYAEVAETLRGMEPGSSAIVASSWAAGERQGGHAYLAVHDHDGVIRLVEPATGQRSGWPPYWGQDAVSLTAVGYLDARGDPIDPLSDTPSPRQLAAAEAVGDVRGPRDEGGGSDPEDRPPQHWLDVPPLDPDEARALADAALAQRVPPVSAEELRHPVGDVELACERARANAAWWDALSAEQQRALIESYPAEIGNAEGIADERARHEANIRSFREDWSALQSRLLLGAPLSRIEHQYAARYERLLGALFRARIAAEGAGVGGPYLLAFDPYAFDGHGRAIVSFGDDRYRAASVSWHVAGAGATIDQLGPMMGTALNHLRSTLREDQTLTVASTAWIGYKTPYGWLRPGHESARVGGEILHADISGFNAARDAGAADGSHFDGNHLFGYSYGTATVGFGGRGGRLGPEMRSVTLIGSPGAGPLRHASEFGVGDHAFVAASSQDRIARLGGRVPGSAGRWGLGVDPAMDFFGAQRVTAEFPAAMATGRDEIHRSYYSFVDKSAGLRSESLANFGRIAAGQFDRVQPEQHRTVVDRPFWKPGWRIYDPADGRPVHLDDGEHHQPRNDCARCVADELSEMYEREIRVGAEPGPAGVPARVLFEAAESRAEVASYAEVHDTLMGMADGSSAIVASSWTPGGARQGGHAYLAVKENGEIRFVDPQTGQRSGWPPPWGQVAVDRVAVGYLDAHGNPIDPLGDTPNPSQLAAADGIGNVHGPRDPGGGEDSDPAGPAPTRDEYRGQDRTTRPVDTRYADPLGEVVDNPDPDRIGQLAEDLSGVYGDYGVAYTGGDASTDEAVPAAVLEAVRLTGDISKGDQSVGLIERWHYRDAGGNLVVHEILEVNEGVDLPDLHEAVYPEWERYCRRSGIDRCEFVVGENETSSIRDLRAVTWSPDPEDLDASLENIKLSAAELSLRVGPEAADVLRDISERLDLSRSDLPQPFELAELTAPGEPDLGRKLLDNTAWWGAKYYRGGEDQPAADARLEDPQPRGPTREEYRGQDRTIRRVDTRYADPLGEVVDNRDPAQVRQLAEDLSGVYGRYRAELTGRALWDDVWITGNIQDGDRPIGSMTWVFDRDSGGNLVVEDGQGVFGGVDFRGVSAVVYSELLPYFRRCDADRIEFYTDDIKAGYLEARRGGTWNPELPKLRDSLRSVKESAVALSTLVGPYARTVLAGIIERLEPGRSDVPQPIELAGLTAGDEPYLGRELLSGTKWFGVHHLRGEDQPAAWIEDPRPRTDCVHCVAAELREMYGRDIHIDAEPASTGVPARALFEAAGSGARFATYAEVAETLRGMDPRSSAIVASKWAGYGRRGGHAYLAVHSDSGEIQVVDRATGERSGWPPYWGQDAVSRIAVGYLDAHGNPIDLLGDTPSPSQSAAAEEIGDVQGPRDEGGGLGPDERPPEDPGHGADVGPGGERGLGEGVPTGSRGNHDDLRAVAEQALSQRVPPFGVKHLDNSWGDVATAAARAKDTAAWWQSFTADQQEALIQTIPREIGDAEGVEAWARHKANCLVVQHYLAYRDELQARSNAGARLSRVQLYEIDRINWLDAALRSADEAASRAGLSHPCLLAFNSVPFGAGRAIFSFGADPHLAKLVSWHFGEGRTPIDDLALPMDNAVNQLQSTLREQPGLPAASLAYIGFDTPADWASHRVDTRLARAAGEVVYRDISTFNATHDAWAADGGHFSGNHVFAGGYGSTVVDYAGLDERLAPEVRRIISVGPPGEHPTSGEQPWNPTGEETAPVAEPPQLLNGAQAVAAELSVMYGRGFHLDVEPGREGMPARALFEAAGSAATWVHYSHVWDRLGNMASGSSAILASNWVPGSGRKGGTAYLAVKTIFDEVASVNPETGEIWSWPPPWGQERVSRTAVGYLGPDGLPSHPLAGVPGELWAADIVGDVQALPDKGGGSSSHEHGFGGGAPAGSHTDPDVARAVAVEALAQRVPPVWVDELVNPLGSAELACERARANAGWWDGLNTDQRNALIHTYPAEIGNAEGIPVLARHEANSVMVQRDLAHRDELQFSRDDGVELNPADLKHIERMTGIEAAWRAAGEAAQRAGVGGPYWLAYDPLAFGGDGRAVVGFGADPYRADSVSWHVPGLGTMIDSLDFCMHTALNHLQSTLQEDASLSAASLAWIGYDVPNDLHDAADAGLARAGGDVLYSDIRAFNAARDVRAADGSHFSGNRVFGHCYGSTTVGYAGEGGRLGRDVHAVSLVGSPGAGPLRHAGEFGVGDKVFVFASSRDPVAARGGETPGAAGRMRGSDLGIDPAMEFFGGQRVRAEFSAAMDRKDTFGTHNAYYDYVDTDGGRRGWLVTPDPAVRSESLANLGRIGAGRYDQLDLEGHRTVVDRPAGFTSRLSTHDPAAERHLLRLVDDPHGHHPIGRRYGWDPRWHPGLSDCVHRVAGWLSERYPDREFGVDAEPGPRGVRCRALFEAAGSASEFASYDEVGDRLRELGSGSSAIVASSWARGSGRKGGHAYLAVNDNDEIRFVDPKTGEGCGWPPPWGQDAVSRTAVGYLDAHGNPVHPLDGTPDESAADFLRRQEEYRAQDPRTRRVDTRYAEPLGDVVDNASDRARVRQLAEDLSGSYGPYRIQLEGKVFKRGFKLTGVILSGDTRIASRIRLDFGREDQRDLVAEYTSLFINDKQFRGKGFLKALTSELEGYYIRSGVDRVRLLAVEKGSYAWARRGGFTWDLDPERLQNSLKSIKDSARELSPSVSPEAQRVLSEIVQRLDPGHPDRPELIELAALATPGEPNLGEQLLDRTHVYMVKHLRDGEAGPGRAPGEESGPLDAADAVGRVGARDGHGGLGPDDRPPEERWRDVSPPDPDAARALADTALAQRVPPVGAEELRNPLGSAELAWERARANAAWWDGLPPDQQRALIESYPVEIGNAEGIPALARHDANSLIVQRLLAYRDKLQARLDSGVRLSREVRAYIARMNGIEAAWRSARDAANRAGVGGPYLLAFDPRAFDGAGRAVVSFGDDPYRAESVSWHVPGMAATVDSPFYMHAALNQLQSVRREDPTLSAASIAWIGYKAPRGWFSAAGHRLARAGGETLCGDISAFNAARDVWAADGSHFDGNHVFGHSYGSSALGYAGEGGRLGTEVRTITLIGSPGAGPIRHASEFGVGDKVFVGSSSRDSVTAFGGPTPGSAGRIRGRGVGVDPAMDFFGGQRFRAEFSAAMDRKDTVGTHNAYYDYVDTNGGRRGWLVPPDPAVRTESLANLGRIGAGRFDQVDLEEHRTVVERPPSHRGLSTHDPAAGRDLELRDDPQGYYPSGRRHWWSPRWAPHDPVPGPGDDPHDPDFLRQQQEYRAQDPTTRRVDTRYAELLGDVVDNASDSARVRGPDQGDGPHDPEPDWQYGESPDPVSLLALPNHQPSTLSDVETSAVYTQGELRMRDLNEQLLGEGVSAEDRAGTLFDLRRWLRAWTRELMSNRTAADLLGILESNPTFDDLVAQNQGRGLVGDDVYNAIIDTATRSHYQTGTLSAVETTAIYTQGERWIRDLNDQLASEALSAEDRARTLIDLRRSLRTWTRALMSNRTAADLLAAIESDPTFDDLVAKNQARGLAGDDVYDAIIDTATHSHYAAGTLSNFDTRTVYTQGELRMRDLTQQLIDEGPSIEEIARIMHGLRRDLRTWTRALMSDRPAADWLAEHESNPTFEEFVARYRARGLVGDDIYRAIIDSSTRSRASVNEPLGIDPDNPPKLPSMRGPDYDPGEPADGSEGQ